MLGGINHTFLPDIFFAANFNLNTADFQKRAAHRHPKLVPKRHGGLAAEKADNGADNATNGQREKEKKVENKRANVKHDDLSLNIEPAHQPDIQKFIIFRSNQAKAPILGPPFFGHVVGKNRMRHNVELRILVLKLLNAARQMII